MPPISDIIFPPRCAHCLRILPAGALCAACRAQIKIKDSYFCGSCRARAPAKSVCHPSFPYLLAAAADYKGPVESLVKTLKFGGVRDAAAEIADLMAQYLNLLAVPPDMFLVPVSLSSRRQRERGFNQAELIALELAGFLHLPLLPEALIRVRHTAPQAKTSSIKERVQNVDLAFRAEPELVGGKRIFLIDDVVTSGSTLLAAASALRSAGALKVIGLAAGLA